MNLLRKIRVTLAITFLVLITILFLDFTGTLHSWFGWLAKIQFLPALLALNIGVVVGLISLTWLFGRVYCSVICPLGLFQDVVSKLNTKKNRLHFSPAIKWMRYGALALFLVAFVAGIGAMVALLDPYSAYGRIVANLFAPIYQGGNNLLAYLAERADSYAFYHTEVWIKSTGTGVVAAVTLIVIVVLAWRNGRAYCNTICLVGTILGLVAKFSLFKVSIDTAKCNGCGRCARNCKSSCINPQAHTIDYTRCVSCFDCMDKCHKEAIRYERRRSSKQPESNEQVASTRRDMLTVVGALVATSVVKAQEKKVDGGLAFIEDKKIPKRQTTIVPPGAKSIRNFTKRCTACQLCVSVCPNQVLRPSTELTTFMQPKVSYERGYCRPECTQCSEVCPSGAIELITKEEKSSIQVGHAMWIEKNCVVHVDGVECGNCAKHCPTGAITMITKEPDSLESRKIPVVNIERCIGCGACENLCPARPFSAIYVEGHTMHRII